MYKWMHGSNLWMSIYCLFLEFLLSDKHLSLIPRMSCVYGQVQGFYICIWRVLGGKVRKRKGKKELGAVEENKKQLRCEGEIAGGIWKEDVGRGLGV